LIVAFGTFFGLFWEGFVSFVFQLYVRVEELSSDLLFEKDRQTDRRKTKKGKDKKKLQDRFRMQQLVTFFVVLCYCCCCAVCREDKVPAGSFWNAKENSFRTQAQNI
jgi:hypothetical protein